MSEGRLLILADDFTGACDAAASFAAERVTLVVLGVPADWPAEAEEVEVLGTDLDLREHSSAEAEARTREAARQVGAGQQQLRVFLKIDSTLRGPIAGLVAGALAGSGRSIAVIAPAFPEQGRFLREGRVQVDGRPGASLIEGLGMDHTALVGANFARSSEKVALAVEHARGRGARYVVVDADGVDCLRSVAQAWQQHPEWLLVGSAGLARQVAGTEQHRPDVTPTRGPRRGPPPGASGRGPVLVVAGSPAPATQSQIEQLRGLGPIVLVGVTPHVSRRPSGDHHVIVVCTPPASERDSGERATAVADVVATWASNQRTFTSSKGMSTITDAARNAPGWKPGALVLAGGSTARLFCERLGVRGVRLQGELEPGIPFGHLVDGIWAGLRVVTKAGGFGQPTTLLDVVHALGVSSVAEPTHD